MQAYFSFGYKKVCEDCKLGLQHQCAIKMCA